jgi:Outer membrane lipoprotein carrier protein LolA-like
MRTVRPLAALGVFLVALALAVPAHPAPAWGLGPLMQSLAEVHGATATFTETKTLAILKTPLTTSGTLRYVAPDYVRKTVLAPSPQEFVLQNGVVTLTAAGRTRRFSLNQAPPLAGLVEGVRAALAGDLPTLDRYYTIQLSGGAERWQLLLRPRGAGLSRFLSWLSIGGSANRISEIDTGGAHGDLTRMSIDETIDHAP